MNTHDIDIKLPPLPEWVDWPVTVSEMSASEIKEAMQDYALAAYQAGRDAGLEEAEAIADRQHFGGECDDDLSWTDCAAHIAASIRALKSDAKENKNG